MLEVAVVRFPGSNCDLDALRAAETVGAEAYFVWHRDTDLRGADVVILPGGFSYGDYLRSGAIARFSPIMQAVQHHAAEGGAVLGICNGFQILCESHLLPGALLRNAGLTFVSKPVDVRGRAHRDRRSPRRTRRVTGCASRWRTARAGTWRRDDTLRMLEAEGRVVLRYVAATEDSPLQPNPNGSANHIAGHLQRRRHGGRASCPTRSGPPIRLWDAPTGCGFFTSMVARQPQSPLPKVSNR